MSDTGLGNGTLVTSIGQAQHIALVAQGECRDGKSTGAFQSLINCTSVLPESSQSCSLLFLGLKLTTCHRAYMLSVGTSAAVAAELVMFLKGFVVCRHHNTFLGGACVFEISH